MPPSRLVAKIGLFLAATLFSLALSEVVVRIVRDPRPMELQEQRRVFPTYYPLAEAGLFTRDRDSHLRYRLTPGFEMELRDSLYRINSLGFRGREQTSWDHPETPRVVLLGDSYAFGLGVDQSETLDAQLESRLQGACRSVAILNLGVPGYHTGQELALAERVGFDLDPDLVVLLFYANDETTEAFQYDQATGVLYGDALPVPYWLKGPLARSAAYRWLARAKVGQMRDRGDFQPLGDRHWPVTRSRLESLFQACADRGVPLVLANIPMLLNSDALQRPDWTGHQNYERVAQLAESHEIPWVDLRSVLLAEGRSPDDPFFARIVISVEPPRDHHLNPTGYSLVADAIAETLISGDLLSCPQDP
jgi:lysophospholipase L1-like esterase